MLPHEFINKLLFGGVACTDDWPLDSDPIVDSVDFQDIWADRKGNIWTFKPCYQHTNASAKLNFKYFTDLTVRTHRTKDGEEIISESWIPGRKSFFWTYDHIHDPSEWVEVIVQDIHEVQPSQYRQPPTTKVIRRAEREEAEKPPEEEKECPWKKPFNEMTPADVLYVTNPFNIMNRMYNLITGNVEGGRCGK